MYVVILPGTSHNTSCRVLDGLELLHQAVADTVQQAVVGYNTRTQIQVRIVYFFIIRSSRESVENVIGFTLMYLGSITAGNNMIL